MSYNLVTRARLLASHTLSERDLTAVQAVATYLTHTES